MSEDTPGADGRHVTVEQTPFAQVPETVIYDGRLTDKALRVYACLLRHGTDPKNCYPSHARIGELIGCSERSVARPLNELVDAGWVVKVHRPPREDGSRQSDGYFVRTARQSASHDAGERGGVRAGARSTAQEHAEPPRASAQSQRAPERDERDNPLKENQGNERLAAPGTWIEKLEPSGPVALRTETSAILRRAVALSEDPFTATDRRTLRPVIEEAVAAGYSSEALAQAIASSPFRTGPAVMGELRKAKQRPTSVGNRGMTVAQQWAEGDQ